MTKGVEEARGEWVLVWVVHNIKKIRTRLLAKGGEIGLTRGLDLLYRPY